MKIEIYGKPDCKWCVKATELCKERGWHYIYANIQLFDADQIRAYLIRTGFAPTVPQIFINDKLIGGFDKFSEFAKTL